MSETVPYRQYAAALAHKIVIRKLDDIWTWTCYGCRPITTGGTLHWHVTMANVGRHLRNRLQHHAWVRSFRPAAPTGSAGSHPRPPAPPSCAPQA